MFTLLLLSNSRSDHHCEVIFLICLLLYSIANSDFKASEEIKVPILLISFLRCFSPHLSAASLLYAHIHEVIQVVLLRFKSSNSFYHLLLQYYHFCSLSKVMLFCC